MVGEGSLWSLDEGDGKDWVVKTSYCQPAYPQGYCQTVDHLETVQQGEMYCCRNWACNKNNNEMPKYNNQDMMTVFQLNSFGLLGRKMFVSFTFLSF